MSNIEQPVTAKSLVDSAVTSALQAELEGKKFWVSKTFWANILAAAALGLQFKWGFIVGPEYQALALTFINLALRKITRQPIVW